MDAYLGFKKDYIRSKGYYTLNKRPLDECPENQIIAVFYRLRNEEHNVVKKSINTQPVKTDHKKDRFKTEVAPVFAEQIAMDI